jgi:DNA end-binding protein Ku
MPLKQNQITVVLEDRCTEFIETKELKDPLAVEVDQYETALVDLINQKRAGKPITPKERLAASNVVDLMEALRRSAGKETAPAKAEKPAKRQRKAASGQKEMLMPIEGKKLKEAPARKTASKPQRKSA